MIQDKTPSRSIGLAVAIIAAGAVLAGVVMLIRSDNVETKDVVAEMEATPNVLTSAVAGAKIDTATIIDENDPVVGVDTAPVTAIIFTNFSCAFCRHWHETTFQQIKQDFIDTGQVKFVLKIFPIATQQEDIEATQRAANAALCAQAQNQFWPYSDYLLRRGASYEHGQLLAYAEQLPIDVDEFGPCLVEQRFEAVIDETIRDAISSGITDTPSLIIGNQLYEGEMSYQQFASIIQSDE